MLLIKILWLKNYKLADTKLTLKLYFSNCIIRYIMHFSKTISMADFNQLHSNFQLCKCYIRQGPEPKKPEKCSRNIPLFLL